MGQLEIWKPVSGYEGLYEVSNTGKISRGEKEYSPKTCCFIPSAVNSAEANRRNPESIRKAIEANKTKYVLSKESERLIFQSEKEACEQLGVHKCSVASCYRRGYKCKGYTIAKMDGDG